MIEKGAFGYAYPPPSPEPASTAAGARDGKGPSSSLRTPLLSAAAEEGEEQGKGLATQAILRDVDLVVPRGELAVVYGPTGAYVMGGEKGECRACISLIERTGQG